MAAEGFLLNKPQARAHLLRSNKLRFIAGRGLGKSQGVAAPRIRMMCELMPSTSIAVVGASYVQLLTKIIPGIKAGFDSLGWIEGVHYFVGDYAPAKWKWEKPRKRPDDKDHLFHICTGNLLALISQVGVGTANGYDLVGTICDESRFLKKQQYDDEVVPAMRGDHEKFGHLWCYRSELFTSDMPMEEHALWLVDPSSASGEGINAEQEINDVIALQWLLDHMSSKEGKVSSLTWKKKILPEIHTLEYKLNVTRRKMDSLIMADSIENIINLGEDYIKDLDKKLSPRDFRRSVLNHRIMDKEKNFYPLLSDLIHGYAAVASKELTALGYTFNDIKEYNSMYDGDVDRSLPLHIACDYGANFNCIQTGQFQAHVIRYIKNHYLDYPHKITHVVKEWKRYFRNHTHKEVYYYYDQTADFESAISDLKYYRAVEEILRSDEYGSWVVHLVNIGTNKSYEFRQELWNNTLQGKLADNIVFQFNLENAQQWYESCKLAEVVERNGKLEKDKSSERVRSKGYAKDQVRATHLSEAGDVLLIGMVTRFRKVTHHIPSVMP